MSQDTRILNISRQFRLKRNQAERAIAQCSCVWVEHGKTVRDCNLQEAIQLRALQEKEYVAIESSELPGITFKPPIGAQAAHYMERQRAFEANAFYTLAVQ